MSLIKATIVNTDAKKVLVKVKFEQHDNMVSGWLHILQANASGYQIYSMPEKGARVYVDMDENLEDGVLVGAYYDDDNPPPSAAQGVLHIKGADGSEILLDNGNVKIKVPGAVNIEAGDNATIKATNIILDGNVYLGGADALTAVEGSFVVKVK